MINRLINKTGYYVVDDPPHTGCIKEWVRNNYEMEWSAFKLNLNVW